MKLKILSRNNYSSLEEMFNLFSSNDKIEIIKITYSTNVISIENETIWGYTAYIEYKEIPENWVPVA